MTITEATKIRDALKSSQYFVLSKQMVKADSVTDGHYFDLGELRIGSKVATVQIWHDKYHGDLGRALTWAGVFEDLGTGILDQLEREKTPQVANRYRTIKFTDGDWRNVGTIFTLKHPLSPAEIGCLLREDYPSSDESYLGRYFPHTGRSELAEVRSFLIDILGALGRSNQATHRSRSQTSGPIRRSRSRAQTTAPIP